jgi:hypothetical protein
VDVKAVGKHTSQTTASNINICQCRCDTSRDNTWTLISRFNITCTGIREGGGKEWECEEGRQADATANKQGCLRKLCPRTVFRPKSIHERGIGLSRRERGGRDNVNERPQMRRKTTHVDQSEHLSRTRSGPSSPTTRCHSSDHVRPRRSQRSPQTWRAPRR